MNLFEKNEKNPNYSSEKSKKNEKYGYCPCSRCSPKKKRMRQIDRNFLELITVMREFREMGRQERMREFREKGGQER